MDIQKQKQKETAFADRLMKLGKFLLNELVSGENLRKYVSRDGKVDKSAMKKLLKEIADKNKKKVDGLIGVETEKSMDDIDLFDLIKQYAPEGTSDEVIEKAVGTITRSVLRRLGAAGRKLRGFKGRKIQSFGGAKGFWVTRNGRRQFLPLNADEARRLSKLPEKEFAQEVAGQLDAINGKTTATGKKLNRLLDNPGTDAAKGIVDVARDVTGLIADVISFT